MATRSSAVFDSNFQEGKLVLLCCLFCLMSYLFHSFYSLTKRIIRDVTKSFEYEQFRWDFFCYVVAPVQATYQLLPG